MYATPNQVPLLRRETQMSVETIDSKVINGFLMYRCRKSMKDVSFSHENNADKHSSSLRVSLKMVFEKIWPF